MKSRLLFFWYNKFDFFYILTIGVIGENKSTLTQGKLWNYFSIVSFKLPFDKFI